MVAEDCDGRRNVEGFDAEPMADSPSERYLKAGLSGVLGGWSGGTLTSTLLSVPDFSLLSRGETAVFFPSCGCRPPRRRSARRHPATRPLRATERKPPGTETTPLTSIGRCNSRTNSA